MSTQNQDLETEARAYGQPENYFDDLNLDDHGSSKSDIKIIKMYFDWFSQGYEDFGELDNFEP